MDDGLLVPSNADGMTCIQMSKNKVILIRNHEIGHVPRLTTFFKNNLFGKNYRRYKKKNASKFYDINRNTTHCFGGTTSIVYNMKTEKVEKQYLSLAGTLVNCSGGKTPWGTWISCEETVINKGRGITKNHGYNFEVIPSLKPNLTKAIPLKDMGRFRHEGVAFDVNRGYVYQTEDRSDGLFYRFIPKINSKLFKGGKLQALSFMDEFSLDTRNWGKKKIEQGKPYNVRWFDLENVESENDDLRNQGYEKGCAIFARPEGMWEHDGRIYFTCTSGGKNKLGQIWEYTPSLYEGSSDEEKYPGKLQLFQIDN